MLKMYFVKLKTYIKFVQIIRKDKNRKRKNNILIRQKILVILSNLIL